MRVVDVAANRRVPRPAPGPPARLVRLIDERLRRHLSPATVAQVRDAVLRGQVVHLSSEHERGPVVAFKRGVLFVAGTEYVISDE